MFGQVGIFLVVLDGSIFTPASPARQCRGHSTALYARFSRKLYSFGWVQKHNNNSKHPLDSILSNSPRQARNYRQCLATPLPREK
jgi:hypothetical protein